MKNYIKIRSSSGKISFIYFERILKRGLRYGISPRLIKYMLTNHTFTKSKNNYLLAASAYAPLDFALYGSYIKKNV